MVANNVLGFTGVSVFARYVATPMVVIWALYMVIKGFAVDSESLGGTPDVEGGLGFWPGVGIVLGFLAYGNEPDTFRFGKPRFWWPTSAYAFALIFGLLLFSIGGWMMAELAQTADFAGLMRFTVHYSLFGVFWLAWILATLTQIAINDSNYYEAINASQNVIGGWSKWRRFYTCAIAAGGAALGAWLVPYVITNGFFKLANFLAITVVSASVIMVIDHFLLPRLFNISRPLVHVPGWSETAIVNWPATVALVIAVGFGGYAAGIFPGEDPTRYWGLPPVMAWVLAGVLYVIGVAVSRAWAREPRSILGFSRVALRDPAPPGAILDIASEAGVAPAFLGGQPKPSPPVASEGASVDTDQRRDGGRHRRGPRREPFQADILIDDGLIVAVGSNLTPVRPRLSRAGIAGDAGPRQRAFPLEPKLPARSLPRSPLEALMLYAYPFYPAFAMSPDLVYLRTCWSRSSLSERRHLPTPRVIQLPTQDLDQLDAVFRAYTTRGFVRTAPVMSSTSSSPTRFRMRARSSRTSLSTPSGGHHPRPPTSSSPSRTRQ